MKVHYLPKNRANDSYLKKILILITIFICGVIVFFLINEKLIVVFSSFWRAKNDLTIGTIPPSEWSNFTQENMLLELAGRKQKENMVIAAVLTRPPQTPYDVIILDAGANESLAIGSEVSLPEGSSLGTVSEIFSNSARVTLFSATGKETNAVLERHNIPVILVGAGGGSFRLTLPRDIAVEIGDRILSPDITSRHLATVGEVSMEPTDSFKLVLANSPTNIFTLRFVFVTP